MAIQWNEYQKIREIRGFDIYQRRGEDTPRFAFRGTRDINQHFSNVANHMADVEILVDEFYIELHGRGIASGYCRGKEPQAEEIYRDVSVGKFLYRGDAVALAKYMAIVRPDLSKEDKKALRLRMLADQVYVEGNSIKSIRRQIDATIRGFPKRHRSLYPDP